MPDTEAPSPRNGDPARPPPFDDGKNAGGAESADAKKDEARARKRKRLRLLAGVGALVVIGGLGYYLYNRQFESTDDAQIDANISNIGARVSGTIMRVAFDENQHVRAGEALAEIDPTDLAVALAQAKASVAQAVAQLGAEDPTVSITETSNATASGAPLKAVSGAE